MAEESCPLSAEGFQSWEILERAWWKNHVMPIAATVTSTLPAHFLCRTAQKKTERHKKQRHVK